MASATLRRRIPALRTLFIPNAITAGVAGLLLGPQVLGFERAINDLGQSSGTVVSGFLLIDMSDPEQRSGVHARRRLSAGCSSSRSYRRLIGVLTPATGDEETGARNAARWRDILRVSRERGLNS